MKHLTAIIFGAAIVIAALLLGNSYVKRANPPQIISVTGLGNKDFVSDLIVWEGRFNASNVELKAAFDQLIRDKDQVKNYLISKGLKEENIIFEATGVQSELIKKKNPVVRTTGTSKSKTNLNT